MSDLRRYIVWKAAEPLLARLAAFASDREEPSVPGDAPFRVLLLREEEIEAVLRDDPASAFLRDGDLSIAGHVFDLPGAKSFGLDVPLAPADSAGRRSARPGEGVSGRRRAEALIGAEALRAWAAPGRRKVNVVIVDGGLDVRHLAEVGYGAVIEAIKGAKPPHVDVRRGPSRRHAHMIARSVLSQAPLATLIDVPVLSERIDAVDAWAAGVLWPLWKLAFRILAAPLESRGDSWVVVCAWSLLSRAYDRDLGTYAEDRRHPLSLVFTILSQLGADIVFSAGNNGQFWPDLRSGATDRGPGRSILGSNGLPEVLTVGAVSATGAWIGESAQGPEPAGLRPPDRAEHARKPDVCAPSWFREDGDRHALVTGTSAACAMAAGVVAAVRRRVSQKDLPPAALIQLIRDTARREGYDGGGARGTPAEQRLGSGVIDGEALVAALP